MSAAALLALVLAADQWSTGDTVREVALATVAAVDVATTVRGIERGKYEAGIATPLLGRHPSPARLAVAAGAGVLVHAAIARALPRPFRETWQYLILSVDALTVGGNMLVLGEVQLRW